MANLFIGTTESNGGGQRDLNDLDNLYSTDTNDTVTAPDGTTTANTLAEDSTATQRHGVNASKTTVSSTKYFWSAFVKAGTRDHVFIGAYEISGQYFGKWFNVSTGVAGSNGDVAPDDFGIVPYGDGWYRCWVSGTPTATLSYFAVDAGDSDGGWFYNGAGSDSLYFWGLWADTVNYTDWGTRTYTYPTTGTGGAALDTDWFTTETRGASSTLGLVSNKIRFVGETIGTGFGCRLQLLDGNGNGLWLENAKIECDIDFITDDDFRSYLWLTARQGALDDWPADNYGDWGDPNDGVSARGWQFASVTSAQIWTREEAAGVANDLYASTVTAPVSGSTYHCEFTVDGNQVTSTRDLVGTGNQLNETDTTTITAGGYLAISFSGNDDVSTIDIYNIVVTNLDAPDVGLKAQWDVNTRGRTDDDFYEHVNGTAETSTGSPTKDETYAFDGLTFNGTSQYTKISTLPVGLSSTFPDSDFTMAVQCKPSDISPTDYMSIFGAYLSTSNITRVHILADISSAEALGGIVAQVGGSGEFTNSNDVIDDQDRHVVVYRRETDVVTLWLDGTKEVSVNATVSDVGTVDTIGFAGKTDLSISDAQSWYFAGTIYWAAIYDEAISDGAVVALGETSNPFVTAVSASVVEHIAPAYHRRVNPLVRM